MIFTLHGQHTNTIEVAEVTEPTMDKPSSRIISQYIAYVASAIPVTSRCSRVRCSLARKRASPILGTYLISLGHELVGSVALAQNQRSRIFSNYISAAQQRFESRMELDKMVAVGNVMRLDSTSF